MTFYYSMDGKAWPRHGVRSYVAGFNANTLDNLLNPKPAQFAVGNGEGRLPAPPKVETNDAGSEVYPASLAGAVRYAHEVSGVPVIVTEHGINSADDSKLARLIPAALAELKRAMDDGVPVLGYVHWSLVDNFEWVFGYKPKFGLHALDRTTFKRIAKPSAAVLGGIARRNAI